MSLRHYNKFQISSKRKQLRNNIRRKQIQHYFDNTRTKYNQQTVSEEKAKIRNHIDGGKKQSWLLQRAQELRELPCQQWHSVLRLLSIGCGLYRQDYSNWVNFGIMDKLVCLLQPQFGELKLASISACVLEEIFQTLPEDTPIVQKFLKNNFISNLINLCQQQALKDSLIYFQLINTILCNRQHLSNNFIDLGLVHVLVKLLQGTQILSQKPDDVYIVICVVQRILRGVVLHHSCRYASNVLLVFVPTLGKILYGSDDRQLLRVVLKCFSLLAISQKQYVLAQLFHCNNLINTLLKFITLTGQPFLRSASTNIIASIISSQNPLYARELIQKDILTKLVKCWQFKDNHQQCQNSILKIISNTVSTSLDLAKIVLLDEVFKLIVICSTKKVHYQKNYADSIYIISTLIQYNCPQIMQILLRKFYILEILVQGLNYDVIQLQNCLEIVKCLVQIVQFQKQRDRNQRKKIIIQLEGLYNIEKVLEKVQEKMGNKNVENYVAILLEEMYGES